MRDNNGCLGFLKLATGIVVLGFLATPQSANSQDVANGLATANVQASLVVTAAQDLQFGNVLQGVAKSVANNIDATSGIFNIAGQGSAGISLYFAFPSYMALADGSDRMTVAFSNTDAIVDTNNTSPATAVAGDGWLNVNPRALPAATVVGAGGQTNIYLGGRVTPAVDQKAGAYTGDIILTVAYTGA